LVKKTKTAPKNSSQPPSSSKPAELDTYGKNQKILPIGEVGNNHYPTEVEVVQNVPVAYKKEEEGPQNGGISCWDKEKDRREKSERPFPGGKKKTSTVTKIDNY